jgi:hypothetical protein
MNINTPIDFGFTPNQSKNKCWMRILEERGLLFSVQIQAPQAITF